MKLICTCNGKCKWTPRLETNITKWRGPAGWGGVLGCNCSASLGEIDGTHCPSHWTCRTIGGVFPDSRDVPLSISEAHLWKQRKLGLPCFRICTPGISRVYLCKWRIPSFFHFQRCILEIARDASLSGENVGQAQPGLEGPNPMWKCPGHTGLDPSSPTATCLEQLDNVGNSGLPTFSRHKANRCWPQ